MLLDSNIIIYSHKQDYQMVRNFIRNNKSFVSAISYLETLGYHNISAKEKDYLQQFFSTTNMLPISNEIIQKAITLRQQQKISLGDSLIAATALVHNLVLVTRNIEDFKWIEQLKLINPID